MNLLGVKNILTMCYHTLNRQTKIAHELTIIFVDIIFFILTDKDHLASLPTD